MSNILENNKRIAKNSLVLYIRMFFVLGISLFTSRIILRELGVNDYGIYVVVGGIVSLLSFLNSCSTSTQRFLNYEIGKEESNIENLKSIFSNALSIHLLIAFIMVLLAETIGLWFVNYKLVIPAGQIYSANIIYQCSIIIFSLSVLQMPYMADIIAHEKMSIYAYMSILEVVLKLIVALCISLFSEQRLIFYGILLAAVQVIISALYINVCIRKFAESSLRLSYTPILFKELLKFTGWNMFGSIAWIARTQGIGIILNLFGGVILNAAKGISDQVSNAVNSLSNNFQLALNPQITKNYAANNILEMEKLAYRGVKFSSLLLWIIGLPLILNIDYVLSIWLGSVPAYSTIFIILSVIDILVSNLFGSPIMASISATGRIRNYQITVSTILLLALPTSYVALKFGFPPQVVFILNIIFSIIGGIVRLAFCVYQIGFSINLYIKRVLLPVIFVIAVSSPLPIITSWALQNYGLPQFIRFVVIVIFSIINVVLCSYYLAFNNIQRKRLRHELCRKFKLV